MHFWLSVLQEDTSAHVLLPKGQVCLFWLQRGHLQVCRALWLMFSSWEDSYAYFGSQKGTFAHVMDYRGHFCVCFGSKENTLAHVKLLGGQLWVIWHPKGQFCLCFDSKESTFVCVLGPWRSLYLFFFFLQRVQFFIIWLPRVHFHVSVLLFQTFGLPESHLLDISGDPKVEKPSFNSSVLLVNAPSSSNREGGEGWGHWTRR